MTRDSSVGAHRKGREDREEFFVIPSAIFALFAVQRIYVLETGYVEWLI